MTSNDIIVGIPGSISIKTRKIEGKKVSIDVLFVCDNEYTKAIGSFTLEEDAEFTINNIAFPITLDNIIYPT